eukprot:6186459-Pleurochrysis_carterae.AAC.1
MHTGTFRELTRVCPPGAASLRPRLCVSCSQGALQPFLASKFTENADLLAITRLLCVSPSISGRSRSTKLVYPEAAWDRYCR